MNNVAKKVSFAGFLMILLYACAPEAEEIQGVQEEKAKPTHSHIVVRLTDKPGDYEAVNIDIQDVQVNAGDDESGWKSITVRKGIYDLLKLTNGLDTLLGEIDLPPGRLSQIRLILGPENTVLTHHRTFQLSTPSAKESGLKVQVDTDIKAGSEYDILLDFDAARSVVRTGGGKYKLKPVIRAIVYQKEQEGAAGGGGSDSPPAWGPGNISGIISPSASNPAIHAIIGTDTVSTMVNSTGKFLIGGLPDGTYRVVVIPIDGYLQEERTGVKVVAGTTTDVGTIVLGHL